MWIKLYRTLLEWEWYNNPNTKHLFIHLLLKANYKSKNWQGLKIQRGQLVTSVINLSAELSLTIQEVRTALKHLQKTGEISIRATNKFSIITINNFNDFQEPENSELTNKQQTKQQTNNKQNNKQNPLNLKEVTKAPNKQTISKLTNNLTTTKEYKNKEEEKEIYKEKDFVLKGKSKDFVVDSEFLTLLKKTYPYKDVEGELMGMRLWLEVNPKKRKVNIKRFINNWLSRAKDNFNVENIDYKNEW